MRYARCTEPFDAPSRADRRTRSVRCSVDLWRRTRAHVGLDQDDRASGPTSGPCSRSGPRSRSIGGHRGDVGPYVTGPA
jgi:hypothetical protein